MRELLLMRHGKAYAAKAGGDLARPLKDRGKRAAQRVGVWLDGAGIVPDHVLASSAERASATAEKCGKAMGLDARLVTVDDRLHAADVEQALAVLHELPREARRVLLVGHNPWLPELVAHLCGTAPQRFPTAALAHLHWSDDQLFLRPSSARMQAFVRPAELPDDFPFPSPHGSERRERPAYYYTQSAVVPYRIADGQVQVLIVRSSQQKHWVVPKGIADPGHSLQESAAKEAMEEAGVEGEVEDAPLGTYSYVKWGADCTVTVYAMHVTRVLDTEEWEERHRGRDWVSARVASMLVKQAAVGRIIADLEQRFADT